VIVVNQLATKLFTAENKQGNFDTGDKAILMPQLGESERDEWRSDPVGELWTTAKTVRLALFRGPPGDDVRYAHASTSSTGSADADWAAFDVDVSLSELAAADLGRPMGSCVICPIHDFDALLLSLSRSLSNRWAALRSCRKHESIESDPDCSSRSG
jgi:hypothetical protein